MGAAVAAIGLVLSAAQGKKQSDAIEDSQDEADRLAQEAEENERQFLAQQAKEADELKRGGIKFGVEDTEPVGSFDDFLAPVQQSTGLSTGKTRPSGLGFA